ncbi:subtilisin-like protease SBT5.3 [Cucumis melo var. makuwa]|uniref:Subtilisin-like protease SBT5.3 n=1 Tax=Cucumis melo var. makuwa TaxID=1194695 RepID=A0A5D3D790_CUCMM|nr:subtilisin-like protease SBT5.3 [Cucumis melo var. makuwa]
MIANCISSVQYSFLSMANQGAESNHPEAFDKVISPFIFVLAMDYLSHLITDLEGKGKIGGVKFGPKLNLTHILFADDILIFVEDNEEYISNLKMALLLLESSSGLNINLNKSTIFPINVPVNRANIIAESWGLRKDILPTSYLGMPLGGNLSFLNFWDNILQKIQKKLSSWFSSPKVAESL